MGGTGARKRRLAKKMKRYEEAFQNRVNIAERVRLKKRNKKKKGK